jgi:RNA polymerase sigma-70 factor (ECF subfamily)
MVELNDLISGSINNDRISQKKIYDLYSSKLYSICLRYAKDSDEANDILQDGFIKIFSNLRQFNKGNSFDGWVKRIIVNTAITNYNLQLKHYNQEDITEINESTIKDIDIKESDFTLEELLSTLKVLPQGTKTIFNLYAIEGYKHKEIAEILGITVSTSKSQYHRGKKILQNKLFELSKEK